MPSIRPFHFLLIFVIFISLAGCTKGGDAAFVNEGIAQKYAEFYTLGPSNPDAALNALREAQRSDPENAYSILLEASHSAQQGEFSAALDLMLKASAMPKSVHYVASLPPDDPMQTLNRVRQLGFTAKRLKGLGGREVEYFRAVRKSGEQVAKSEPVTSLGVICGSSMIRSAWQAEIAFVKGADKAAAVESLKRFEAWSDSLTNALSEANKDIVREAGAAASLTEAELADFSRGVPLKDSGKQKRADEARLKLYEAEIGVLRKALESLPN